MKYSLLSFLFCFSRVIIAQHCDCDISLLQLETSQLNIINAEDYEYNPGDKICIPSGTYGGIRFVGFNGTSEAPLLITNCDGQVIINESSYSGISFKNSNYIKFLGSGDTTVKYGIKIDSALNVGSNGIDISQFSSDIEIAFIEIQYTGFAGVMAKTDPDCNDESTWRRGGYVLRNLNIHHNYIHDTGGEGIYIGYTSGYKITSNKSCNNENVFGHWLENVSVHHNRIEHTGWDGIQINLVQKNGLVYNNSLLDCGVSNVAFQNFMMSIGGGNYEVYNNQMINSTNGVAQGVQLISVTSGSRFYNNIVVNPKFNGLFIHNRHEFEYLEGYYIFNNTIINPEKAGVIYNTVITTSLEQEKIGDNQIGIPTLVANNLIINPGNYYELGSTWKSDSENYIDFNDQSTKLAQEVNLKSNYLSRNINDLCFYNAVENDYRPASPYSPLVDYGYDIEALGVNSDFVGNSRMYGEAYDIGAYEYEGGFENFECETPEYLDENTSLILSPILSKGMFRFINGTVKTCVLKLFNLKGDMVYKTSYQFGSALNLGHLTTGLYVVQFDYNNQEEIQKILIY